MRGFFGVSITLYNGRETLASDCIYRRRPPRLQYHLIQTPPPIITGKSGNVRPGEALLPSFFAFPTTYD